MSHRSGEFERKIATRGQRHQVPRCGPHSLQLRPHQKFLYVYIAVSPLGVYHKLPKSCEWTERTGGTPFGGTAILHELFIRLEIKM